MLLFEKGLEVSDLVLRLFKQLLNQLRRHERLIDNTHKSEAYAYNDVTETSDVTKHHE